MNMKTIETSLSALLPRTMRRYAFSMSIVEYRVAKMCRFGKYS